MTMSTMAEACLHSKVSNKRLGSNSEAQYKQETDADGEPILETQTPTPTGSAASTNNNNSHDDEINKEEPGRGYHHNFKLSKEIEEALANPELDSMHDTVELASPKPGTSSDAKSRWSSIFTLQTKTGEVYDRQYAFALCVGVLLSFNAGYVNGSCLTGLIGKTGRKLNVTSHTGTITLAALRLAVGDISEFGFLTSMTLCFFLGSFVAAWLTPNPRRFRIEPSYGPTFLLGAACLTLSSVLAATDKNEKWIFHLASTANGIQNGVSSLYSQCLIRTTGFTGTGTDIGIFFGQFMRGNRKNTWKLVINSTVCFAFWLGGLISLYATTAFLQYSMLVNAVLFLLIGGGVVAFLTLELDISLGAAIFGAWQWRQAISRLETLLQEPAASEIFQGIDESMSSHHQVDALFDQFDTDKSGYIDREELYAALRHVGIAVSKRQSARMMKRADKDGDGTISREEWRDIISVCTSHKDGMGSSMRSRSVRDASVRRRCDDRLEDVKDHCRRRGSSEPMNEPLAMECLHEESETMENSSRKNVSRRETSAQSRSEVLPETMRMPTASEHCQTTVTHRSSATTAPPRSHESTSAKPSEPQDYDT
jgi:uncharacterized membrane protein YoaK (UPF0700 family)